MTEKPEEAIERLDKMVARTTGLLRGIFPGDAADKLVSIKVGELREMHRAASVALDVLNGDAA